MALRHIVYVSRAADHLSAVDLEAILAVAQSRNVRDGVTGLLLYDGDCFLQYLEGPSEAVGVIYDGISADERHHDVVTLVDEPADERCFADWSMGLLRVLRGGAARGGYGAEELTALALSDRLPRSLPGDVRILIVTFACGAFEPSMARQFG